MTRSCATASTNQLDTRLGKAARIVREVIRCSHVEEAVADARGQACVGLGREEEWSSLCPFSVLFDCCNHFRENIQCGGWSHTTVRTEDINAQIIQNDGHSCR